LKTLNSISYRFFTLCFVASSLMDLAAMMDVSTRSFDRDPWAASQGMLIMIASAAIPLYVLWRNLTTLPSDRSLLPAPRSPSQAWALGLAMLFVWLGSLIAGAWLLSLIAMAFDLQADFVDVIREAYLTGTINVIGPPIIFAVELMALRSRN
jgi:hypothetical protein